MLYYFVKTSNRGDILIKDLKETSGTVEEKMASQLVSWDFDVIEVKEVTKEMFSHLFCGSTDTLLSVF